MVHSETMGRVPSELTSMDEEGTTELEIAPLTDREWVFLHEIMYWQTVYATMYILECEMEHAKKMVLLGWAVRTDRKHIQLTPTGRLICAVKGWSR